MAVRDKKPVMAYADDERREKLRKISEVVLKSQSQVLLDLIDEKYRQLFSS